MLSRALSRQVSKTSMDGDHTNSLGTAPGLSSSHGDNYIFLCPTGIPFAETLK